MNGGECCGIGNENSTSSNVKRKYQTRGTAWLQLPSAHETNHRSGKRLFSVIIRCYAKSKNWPPYYLLSHLPSSCRCPGESFDSINSPTTFLHSHVLADVPNPPPLSLVPLT
eukprot:scaffold9075_cov147-Skeletonema_marinoi.AAC.1